MATEHIADEAGGEAIYSSDGLSPLSVPPRPPLFSGGLSKSGDGGSKDEDVVLETEGLLDPSEAMSKFGGKSPSWMTTRQRLVLLEDELKDLELKIRTEEDGDGEDVMKLWSQLSSRVSALSIPKNKQSAQPQQQQQDQSWKERLDRLEAALLGQSSANDGKSILERLENVETLVEKVDDKFLGQASARAKVIRADLEAAAKARAKLSAGSSLGEEGKQIQELYSQLRELEGMSQHLPILANRLEQCSSLHVQASQFSSRMTDMETSINNATLLLNNLSQSLTQVESNISTNLETLNKNMEQLDNLNN